MISISRYKDKHVNTKCKWGLILTVILTESCRKKGFVLRLPNSHPLCTCQTELLFMAGNYIVRQTRIGCYNNLWWRVSGGLHFSVYKCWQSIHQAFCPACLPLEKMIGFPLLIVLSKLWPASWKQSKWQPWLSNWAHYIPQAAPTLLHCLLQKYIYIK